MRHRQTTPQLGRTPSHRKAMLRNMVTDFFRHGKIRTTQAKAKALRPYAEKLITLAKKDTLHARRRAARLLRDNEVLRHLFNDLAPRYSERPGGYTRIIKLPSRSGDNADMAIIELVEAEMKERKKRQKPRYEGPLTAAAETRASQVKAAEDLVPDAVEEVGEAAEDAIEAAGEVVEETVETAKEMVEDVVEKAEEVVDEVTGDDDSQDADKKSE